jgi:hypothetical protein
MDWLFSRTTVITLAVLGGVFAVLASLLQSQGALPEPRVKQLYRIAYGLMIASMVLFVVAGFRASAAVG